MVARKMTTGAGFRTLEMARSGQIWVGVSLRAADYANDDDELDSTTVPLDFSVATLDSAAASPISPSPWLPPPLHEWQRTHGRGVLEAAVEYYSQLPDPVAIGEGDIGYGSADTGEEAHAHQRIQSFLVASPPLVRWFTTSRRSRYCHSLPITVLPIAVKGRERVNRRVRRERRGDFYVLRESQCAHGLYI